MTALGSGLEDAIQGSEDQVKQCKAPEKILGLSAETVVPMDLVIKFTT